MERSGRVEQLKQWRVEAQADLSEAQANLAVAEQRLEACRERLRLLDRLLAVEGAAGGVPLDGQAESATKDGVGHASSVSELRAEELGPASGQGPTPAGSVELLDACERLVRQAGRPLHISELHKALIGSGVVIPGRGTEANLLVRLHRASGRFVRTGRGTYAPPDMAPEVRPVHKRRVRSGT